MFRHQKPFCCHEPGCGRKDGFGTRNDLERHRKSVHGINDNHRKSKVYKCFADNCVRKDKIWPRYDNFQQHLLRVHGDEDIEDLIRRSVVQITSGRGKAFFADISFRSDEWYETTGQQRRQQRPGNCSAVGDLSRRGQNGSQSYEDTSFSEVVSWTTGVDMTSDTQTVEPASLHHELNAATHSTSQWLRGSDMQSSIMVDQGGLLAAGSISSRVSTGIQERAAGPDSGMANGSMDRQDQSATNAMIPASPEPSNFHLDHLELPGTESVMESAMGLLKALENVTQNSHGGKNHAGDYAGSLCGTCQSDLAACKCRTPTFLDLLRDSGEEERQVVLKVVRAGLNQLGAQVSNSADGKEKGQETSEVDGQEYPHLYPRTCPYEGCDRRLRRMCDLRYEWFDVSPGNNMGRRY